jgi:hypothetical protein
MQRLSFPQMKQIACQMIGPLGIRSHSKNFVSFFLPQDIFCPGSRDSIQDHLFFVMSYPQELGKKNFFSFFILEKNVDGLDESVNLGKGKGKETWKRKN